MTSFLYVFCVVEDYLADRVYVTLYGCVSRRQASKLRAANVVRRSYEDGFYFEFDNEVDYNEAWKREVRLSPYKTEVCHAEWS